MNILNTLIGLIGSSADEAVLSALISLSEMDFKAYCNRDDIPAAANATIVSMVLQRYSKLGADGLSGTNFNGVSESYLDGYDASTIALLNKFRKVKLL